MLSLVFVEGREATPNSAEPGVIKQSLKKKTKPSLERIYFNVVVMTVVIYSISAP